MVFKKVADGSGANGGVRDSEEKRRRIEPPNYN